VTATQKAATKKTLINKGDKAPSPKIVTPVTPDSETVLNKVI
jgi:hypothetical protein